MFFHFLLFSFFFDTYGYNMILLLFFFFLSRTSARLITCLLKVYYHPVSFFSFILYLVCRDSTYDTPGIILM